MKKAKNTISDISFKFSQKAIEFSSYKLKSETRKIIVSIFFLALGMILPLITRQIKEIGDTLLPMHFVVMLCGLICGAKYGLCVGFALPIVRSFCFGMPLLYPNAIWMSLELATYGFVIGSLYTLLKKFNTKGLLVALTASMLSGRIVWGLAKMLLLSFAGKQFLLSMFIAEGFIDAIPGIVLQFLLIPPIMLIFERRRK